MGVSVPIFVAYQGAIYGGGRELENGAQYAISENEVLLGQNYSYPVYQIKDSSNSVAIVINDKLTIYQRLFEVNLTINDTPYDVVHCMGSEYSYGEVIQKNEDYTVYQAINVQSGEVMEMEYIIDLLPIFKREFPDFFDGDENYGDVWWLVLPQSND